MRWRRVFLGVLSVGYSKIVVAFMQLAMVPVLATTWGLDTYGQWLMLTTVPIFLGASDFGFGTAAGNRLTAEVAKGQYDEALRTFQSALAVMLLCTVSIFAICLTATLLLPDSLLATNNGLNGEAARQVLAIMCLFGLVALQSSLFMSVMRAEGLFAQTTSLYATMQLGEGIAVMAVALAGGGPVVAAIAYCVARTIGVITQSIFALRRAKWLRLGFICGTRARVRDLLRPSLAAMMLPVGHAFHLQGTALAFGAAGGAALVPFYASLRTLSRVALQIFSALSMPIFPEIIAEHSRGNKLWINNALVGILISHTLIGIISGIVMLSFGNYALKYWTNGHISVSFTTLSLTAAGMALSIIWNPLSNILLSLNEHERFTRSFVLAAIFATALTYGASKLWALEGAMLASLLFDIFVFAIALSQTRKILGPLSFKISSPAEIIKFYRIFTRR